MKLGEKKAIDHSQKGSRHKTDKHREIGIQVEPVAGNAHHHCRKRKHRTNRKVYARCEYRQEHADGDYRIYRSLGCDVHQVAYG